MYFATLKYRPAALNKNISARVQIEKVTRWTFAQSKLKSSVECFDVFSNGDSISREGFDDTYNAGSRKEGEFHHSVSW